MLPLDPNAIEELAAENARLRQLIAELLVKNQRLREAAAPAHEA